MNLLIQFQLILLIQFVGGEWRSGHNPGILVRIEKDSFAGLTAVMSQIMPAYINTDLNLPTDYEYRYSSERWGEIGPKIKFTNINQT